MPSPERRRLDRLTRRQSNGYDDGLWQSMVMRIAIVVVIKIVLFIEGRHATSNVRKPPVQSIGVFAGTLCSFSGAGY